MNLPFPNPGRPEEPGSAFDARPMVAVRRNDRTVWWFAGGAVLAAVLLFSALEARRSGTDRSEVQTAYTSSFAAPEAIPGLVVPVAPIDPATAPGLENWSQPSDVQRSHSTPIPASQPAVPANQSAFTSPSHSDASPYQTPPPMPPLLVSGQDGAGPPPQPGEVQSTRSRGVRPTTARIDASRLENPSATVVQGTLINAVLETALDSTRPGQTRAVVTRDVYGFDGTRILVPRGTRLYGVYNSDIAQGQKRAQIRWTRLLRPDGVSVALDSPAADPLGRAGVEGKVNNHFFQRLGNALVGTTANIGSALVTRNIVPSSPVVVAVPGATQAASQALPATSGQIAPTLTVNQGARTTVFVQHDLDFSSVDEAP